MKKSIIVLIVLSSITGILSILKPNKTIKPQKNDIVILMYHNIENEPWSDSDSLFVKVEEFEKQLKYLKENHYTSIFMKDLETVNSKEKNVVLTFDDGYLDFYVNAFPLLKKYNMKATLYMVSNYLDSRYTKYLNSQQLKELSDSGLIEIGSHTKSHPRLSKLTKEEMKSELLGSKQLLENITGNTIVSLSYPYGNWNTSIINCTKKYYTNAVTTNPGTYNTSKNIYRLDRQNVVRNMDLNQFSKYFE